MDKDFEKGQESVYSNKVRAGRRRTYFFDVRKTKGEDYYITLTESTKRFNGEGYSRHKIFLYKEDFNRFLEGLQDAVGHVKDVLMPEYDYEQFDRRQEEWDRSKLDDEKQGDDTDPGFTKTSSTDTSDQKKPPTDEDKFSSSSDDTEEIDEDMDW